MLPAEEVVSQPRGKSAQVEETSRSSNSFPLQGEVHSCLALGFNLQLLPLHLIS